jgi:hypothetical protein
MIPKDELNEEQKDVIKAAMNTLHELIHGMDNVTGIDPRAVDLIEIAGTLLEQQIEMNVSYPNEDLDVPNLDGLGGNTEHLAKQLGDIEDALKSGAHDDIVKEGGFLFLQPDEPKKPSEDLDSFFNLEDDKEE